MTKVEERKCEVCGNKYTSCWSGQRFCSHECGYKGRRHPKYHKKQLFHPGLIARRCVECGDIFHTKRSNIKRGWGLSCSKACDSMNKRKRQNGKNNPNWKGGISMIITASRGTQHRLYKKGKRYERIARKKLESEGFYVINSAGSKGPFDLVAINESEIKMIQVKSNQIITPKERKEMASVVVPSIAKKEIWLYC
jgi:hypothetical protein